MCDEKGKTVMHILSECSKLVQTGYKKLNDKVATIVHWELCSKYGFEHAKHWYKHRAEERGVENQDTNILREFNIRTARVMEAKHFDIALIDDKKKRETFIIYVGFACQGQGVWKDIEIPRSYIGDTSNVEHET